MKVTILFLSLGLFATSVQAKNSFKGVSAEFSQEKNHVGVTNMPPAASLQGLAICYAVVASYLMQAEYCLQNNVDCSNLKPNETFSVLDLARYQVKSIIVESDKNKDGYVFVEPEPMRSMFSTLYLDGGHVSEAATYATKVKFVANKECFDLDKFVVNSNDWDQKVKGWERLAEIYNEVNLLIKQNGECKDFSCSDEFTAKIIRSHSSEIKKYVNSPLDDKDLVWSFSAKDFGEFINLMSGVGRCYRHRLRVDFKKMGDQVFTRPSTEGFSVKDMKEYIYKVLKDGRPVGLSNVCLDYELPNVDCKLPLHAVAISESKDICLPGNISKCRTVYKVLNTFGPEWQAMNNDGWFDAETLLESVINPKTMSLAHYGEEK